MAFKENIGYAHGWHQLCGAPPENPSLRSPCPTQQRPKSTRGRGERPSGGRGTGVGHVPWRQETRETHVLTGASVLPSSPSVAASLHARDTHVSDPGELVAYAEAALQQCW